MRRLALVALALLLAGCGGDDGAVVASEVVATGAVDFSVRAQGELKAAKATPLRVPGQNFARRQLLWMLPDGSPVKAGDLVARFGAAQSKLELDKALIDLQRNALARANKESELEVGLDRVEVELAQAESALAIARRYARADFEALARNEVLDAVEDEEFLTEKTGVLRWRQDQSAERGTAEINLLGVQRGTLEAGAANKRGDLDALELRAAHDGIFMLATGWSGELPRIGEQMWASAEFANLPDVEALEVELRLPQQEAQGLAVGQKVELTPMGYPEQQAVGEVTWIASAPRAVSRQNPAKFVSAKVSVPVAAAKQHAWVPGQAFTGRITLLSAAQATTVANVALLGEGEQAFVTVLEGAKPVRRAVTLGVRGPARTQVLTGLEAGERVLLAQDIPGKSEEAGAPP
ncbi:MAG: hypothetical protein DCF27_05860 [Lysobacteraceae bacterium]|nr:MAG: hypothetical protein DCF27_05860 [Xanthomonadaceae bacterium]